MSRSYSKRALTHPERGCLPPFVPLIIPNDREYDVSTNELRPIPGERRSGLKIVPETLRLLESIERPVAVVSICGPIRTGKSYILSHMFGLAGARHTTDAKTFGIWIGTTVLDCDEFTLLFMDTEGIDVDAVSLEMKDDASVLVMTVLLSSCLIYNSVQLPKRSDLPKMSQFAQLGKLIAAKDVTGDSDDSSEIKSHFPDFLWLLRDVTFSPTGDDGKHVTPTEYLMTRVLRRSERSSRENKGDLVGRAILTFFPTIECKSITPPSADPTVLENLAAANQDSLHPQFNQQVKELAEYLLQRVQGKKGIRPGMMATGPILAALATHYLEAVNNPDAIPCISDTWQAAMAAIHRESERLLMEAMKYGYVETLLNVLLLIGAAGSGKTHAKHLFLGRPPPPIRQSTPLAEEAIRTISTLQATVTSGNEAVWELVTLQKLKQMIAGGIKARPSFFKRLPPQLPQPAAKKIKLTGAGSHDIAPQSDSYVQSHSTESASDAYSGVTDAHSGLPDEIPDSLPGASVDTPVEHEQDQELLVLIKSCEGSQKLFNVDWVYIIDSGGQPSFREILPLFVHTATAVAFFLKLNEQLSDNPTVEYYDSGGQPCGSSFSSLLTNEQILLHCVRSIQSRQNVSPDISAPTVFVVGTHKDRENECKETRREKNSKLLEILRPCFGDKLAYYSVKRPEEVIYPVNAKTPTADDQKVAKEFRNKVAKMGGRVKLPLPWFVLEQYVDKLALELNRKVLSLRECEQEAKKLEMDQQACEAALVFLDKLDRFFYRPNVLKGLVFCGSQVPLDKISELIKLLHMLLGPPDVGSSHVEQSPSEAEEAHVQPPTRSGQDLSSGMFPDISEFGDQHLRRLRDYGIVTIEILQKFPKHYDEGLFTPNAFLELLTAFQVAAPLSEGSPEFVMPCLLQELAPDEIDKHRQRDPSSPAAPLLIQFPDNWVPAGVFTVLIVYLQNVARWKLCLLSGNPRCFYRNCVEFRLPTGHGGSVTLVDSFQYIEVHVIKSTVKTCPKACSQIVHDIFQGIKQASERLHYGAVKSEIAFFCQKPTSACKSTPHIANVVEDEWVCSLNPDVNGDLSCQHQVWTCENPGNAHLTTKDFRIVQKSLWPIRSKWRKLGIELGLDLGDLDAIQKDHQHCDDRFSAMLQRWLERAAETTWQRLCEALQEPTVGEEGLSFDIDERRCA